VELIDIHIDIRAVYHSTLLKSITKSTFFRTINDSRKNFSRPNWTRIQSYTNVESIKKIFSDAGWLLDLMTEKSFRNFPVAILRFCIDCSFCCCILFRKLRY